MSWSAPSTGLRVLLWAGRAELASSLGPEEARRLRRMAPTLVDPLVSQLPDLQRGGARSFLVATCWMLAFCRASPSLDIAQNAALFTGCLRRILGRVPGPARRLYRWIFFQPWYHRRLIASIIGSENGSKDAFEGHYVPVEGGFGVDYSACAIQKFLQKQGAAELGPYVCALDFVESEMMGLGLERSGTIGTGAPRCDFRWRQKRPITPAPPATHVR